MKQLFAKAIYTFLRTIEKYAAYAQGKGYGAVSIKGEVSAVLRGLGSEPVLAIDIGGNIGNYSKELRNKCSGLEIHIFEPSSINVSKLLSHFHDDPRIYINSCGISDVKGTATLYSDTAGSGLGSMTKRRLDHFGIDFNASEEIITVRFEDYWKSTLNSRIIDILKIDIEGHEMDALFGLGDALAAIKVIQFEFGGCNIDTRSYFQDFYYFFQKNNFSLLRISPFGLEPIGRYREIDEFFSTTNYLAINRNFSAS